MPRHDLRKSDSSRNLLVDARPPIGPGRIDDHGNRVPLDVAVGDKVIYSKYGGTEVKYAGEEYLVLSARDVLAIIEK